MIYTNFSKPILDIVLFGKELSTLVGYSGPATVLLYYIFSGYIIKLISPSFGKLTAITSKLEGSYRAKLTGIMHHSEEIAFFKVLINYLS